MNRIHIFLLLLAMGHDCQAAKQVNSPDGAWTLKRTPLKTLTGDPTEGIGVFPTAGGEPVTIPVKTLNYVTGVTIRWAPDSRTVALAERFARTALITASWFDDQKWHSTIQEDRDLDPLLVKAEELGSKRRGYKTETAELGNWIATDTIEVHGVLGYVGYPNIGYSYHMQIVPGSYPLSGVLSGGYEVGALKYSEYHVEALPATDAARPASSTRYVFEQPCALTGQLSRRAQGGWVLNLNEPINVGSNDSNVQAVNGVMFVTLLGLSPKAAAYLETGVPVSAAVAHKHKGQRTKRNTVRFFRRPYLSGNACSKTLRTNSPTSGSSLALGPATLSVAISLSLINSRKD
jgi:hypothetical protein